MKTAMKLKTGTLAIALTMTMGTAFTTKAVAQNPDAIDNARSVAKSLQQKQANDSDAALNAAGVPATASKPAPELPLRSVPHPNRWPAFAAAIYIGRAPSELQSL